MDLFLQSGSNPTLAAFVAALREHPEFAPLLSHYHFLPPQKAVYLALPPGLPRELPPALARLGIFRLYRHQRQAWEALQQGQHLVIATPTASGKTLIYNLPVVAHLLRHPGDHALYLFPLKALEQDQLKTLMELQEALGREAFTAAIYDGDTLAEVRHRLRLQPPNILITNPDMLHLGILPFHEHWRPLLSRLRYVIIDEVHTYKGILGSHMAQILRRLRRLCHFYGSEPQYILASATIANPAELARQLIGQPVTVLSDSGAPLAGRHFLFFNPPQGSAHFAARLFVHALRQGLATICFTQARKITELMHLWVLRQAPELRQRVSSYRAGFLPEERREIEQRLARGDLLGVISTSALEMGIDIGGLDVCLLVGYPGTMVTTWQRSGRVGRWGQESLVILVAQPDALDQYFMKHPEEFFSRQFEAAVLDPDNPYIVKAHLPCAAQELPLRLETEPVFDLAAYTNLLRDLEKERELLPGVDGSSWYAGVHLPQKKVNIRGIGESFSIFKTGSRRTIGSIDGHRALTECHPGAIYLHKAVSYLVEELDLERRNIYVTPVEPQYFTRIQSEKETEILEILDSRASCNFAVCLGRLKVTQRLVAYEKRRLVGQELLGVVPLDLPPQIFETVGMWFIVPEEVKAAVSAARGHFMGAIHALEHALISLFPLVALADRYDIGGLAHPAHPQVKQAAIFIYDGYPGGVGLAARAYETAELLLAKTRDLIASCPCEDGCPSCIHSPKCGSGNKPLDKTAALVVAEQLLRQDSPQPLPISGTGIGKSPGVTAPANDQIVTLPWPKSYRIVVLDLETQRAAEEVGGWGRVDRMRLAVAVVADLLDHRFDVFREEEVQALVERLQQADLVVGFNLKRFDYAVLQPYTTIPLQRLPTLDILEEVRAVLGYRLSLDHLAEKTLGVAKTGDGLLALQYFREGRWEELIDYCRRDVELTARLFEFGVRHGYLLYHHRRGGLVRLPVDWRPERLFPSNRQP